MAVRTIEVRERVMARNDELAARSARSGSPTPGVTAFNLVSSPGSGKTLLLERTLDALGEELGIAVVTGDVQTQNDADRLARRTDAPGAGGGDRRRLPPRRQPGARRARRDRPRRRPGCSSSRTSATWSARRAGTWARRPRSWSSRSPRARTSRSSTPRCSAWRATPCSTRSTCCPTSRLRRRRRRSACAAAGESRPRVLPHVRAHRARARRVVRLPPAAGQRVAGAA